MSFHSSVTKIDPFEKARNRNVLDMRDYDPPGSSIEGYHIDGTYFSEDARFVSDDFEVYVFYFTTDPVNHDAAHPIFQRVLNLQGSIHPYAALRWHWGGQVTFNYFSTPSSLLYTLQSNTSAGPIYASESDVLMPMTTNVTSVRWQTCPGTSLSINDIDSSRFFVAQVYRDFFNREGDQDGLNFWRSSITQCGFDTSCIGGYRSLEGFQDPFEVREERRRESR